MNRFLQPAGLAQARDHAVAHRRRQHDSVVSRPQPQRRDFRGGLGTPASRARNTVIHIATPSSAAGA